MSDQIPGTPVDQNAAVEAARVERENAQRYREQGAHELADQMERAAEQLQQEASQASAVEEQTPARQSRGPSLNQVQLIGRLARDPEYRYTPSGKPVTSMRVIVNDGYGAAGFNIVCWGQDAEYAGQYLKKGALIHANGRLNESRWADRNTGEIRSRVEVVARVQGLERAREASKRAEREAEYEGAER